jgi:hypothetical protein
MWWLFQSRMELCCGGVPLGLLSTSSPPSVSRRLDFPDTICDGFYDVEGDFPEITDNPLDFPTIAALRHVRCFEADPREVRSWGSTHVCVGGPLLCGACAAVSSQQADQQQQQRQQRRRWQVPTGWLALSVCCVALALLSHVHCAASDASGCSLGNGGGEDCGYDRTAPSAPVQCRTSDA